MLNRLLFDEFVMQMGTAYEKRAVPTVPFFSRVPNLIPLGGNNIPRPDRRKAVSRLGARIFQLGHLSPVRRLHVIFVSATTA